MLGRNKTHTDVKLMVDSLELRRKISKHIGNMKNEMLVAIANEDYEQIVALHNQITALELCYTQIFAMEKPVVVVVDKE